MRSDRRNFVGEWLIYQDLQNKQLKTSYENFRKLYWVSREKVHERSYRRGYIEHPINYLTILCMKLAS